MAKHNYESQNESELKLPRYYFELKQDGWKQWFWVLMCNDWEIIKGNRKFPSRQEVENEINHLRVIMRDRGMCPVIYLPDLEKANDDDSL